MAWNLRLLGFGRGEGLEEEEDPHKGADAKERRKLAFNRGRPRVLWCSV